MSMNEVVMLTEKEAKSPEHQKTVEEKFQEGRPYLHIPEQSKTRDSDDSHSRDINILSLTVGKQINFNSQFRCNKGAVIDAKWRSPRGKKWLRSDDKGFHVLIVKLI